ncbi:DcaP family trimeric outer membrane transporter [uncultured Maribacter sp.]|uniref:DcaP family trimeric outer membrane transporter n=1 Tax=uncultured Maribacter sp. TaxID=431308 RepID=UPI0030EC28E2|tara:strand:- start:175946 stop:177151 length:1206 start_codon:yes stop_codon:yes gene_type:complete
MKQKSLILLGVLITINCFSQQEKVIVNKDSLSIKQIRHPQSPEPKYQKYAISGYVKLVSTFDVGPNIKNTGAFKNSDIPVNPNKLQEKSRLSFDARQTRVGFDGNFTAGNEHIHTYVETDFYSSETLNNYSLRLRLAYINVWKFHIGRDWTTFANLEATPNQVDFQGANSSPTIRNEMIRFVHDLNKKTTLNIAVETHNSDFTPLVQDDPGYVSFPDLVSNITHTDDWGQLSFAKMFRDISYLNAELDTKHEFGYGLNVAGYINTFKTANGTKHDKLMFMGVTGKGISHYILDISGLGLDAVSLAANKLTALKAGGGYLAYEHWWNDKMSSTLVGSHVSVEDVNQQLPNIYKSASYLEANYIATPLENFHVGIAYLYGNHRLQNKDKGNASRIQAMFQYSF